MSIKPVLFVAIALAPCAAILAAEKLPAGVACLLEDNAEELLPKLTNPWGDPGEGHVERDIVFSGASAIRITTLQRYCNFIPGWAYTIKEFPKDGQFRYLRFAWKSDSLAGIMLQLHDDKDWHIRYTAGANKFGWASQTVSDKLPEEWTVVTIDLFKDFGEREIHGIALTMFDGTAGYFDHVYLGRSIADLDAIDATGLADGGPRKLAAEEVERHFGLLISPDASLAYRAFWTLAAGDDSVKSILANKLRGDIAPIDDAKIARWIASLDDDDFAVREEASTSLATHITLARKQMEAELNGTPAPEVRIRLETILKGAQRELTEVQRVEEQTRRVLAIIAARVQK